MAISARRVAPASLRALVAGIGVGALAGLVVAIALAAGHLSLPFIIWGALLGAATVVLARLVRALFRGVRELRQHR